MQSVTQVNILIVEDRIQDYGIIKEFLDIIGFKDYTHIEGINGLSEVIAVEKFDIILLDLCLPECTGIETLQRFQTSLADTPSKSAAIIVLTGVDDFSISKEAMKLGARDYLVKGEYGPNELQRSINFATFGKNNPKRKGTLGKIW